MKTDSHTSMYRYRTVQTIPVPVRGSKELALGNKPFRKNMQNFIHENTGTVSYFSSGWSMTCTRRGQRNAAVLPLPVCAIPMISLPLSAVGMAMAWMGVG
jgi:hypothetical protein